MWALRIRKSQHQFFQQLKMAVRHSPVRFETQWSGNVDGITQNSLPSTQQSSGRQFSLKSCVTCNCDYTPTAYHQKYCATCGCLPARRKSQALVDKISNPTTAVVSHDSDGASDDVFDQGVDDHNFTPHQPSIFSMVLSSNNTKRGNQHFLPSRKWGRRQACKKWLSHWGWSEKTLHSITN